MNLEEQQKKLLELKLKREERNKKPQNINDIISNVSKSALEETKASSAHVEPTTNAPKIEEKQTQNQPAAQDNQQSSKKKRNLEFVPFVGVLTIDPKERQTYEANIQCDLDLESKRKHEDDQDSANTKSGEVRFAKPVVVSSSSTGTEQSSQLQNPHEISSQITATTTKTLQQAEKPVKAELSGEDISHIVKSKNFLDFFNRSSKLMEKALVNPSQSGLYALEDVIGLSNEQNVDIAGQSYVAHSMKLVDQQYGVNRVVTSIEWSPHRNDVLLASYSQNEQGNINDPVGLVALWSLQLKTRPEFYCFSQSQVTSVKFFPYQENLLLGGLYNGQIVLWDLRVKSTPVQRTTFTTGHSYPIYSLDVVGSVNSHNIVSISNDGKLCMWNMNMLTSPQKTIDQLVYAPQDKPKQDINVTCMQFPAGDANNFYIGSEDGSLYRTQLHSKAQNNSYIVAATHAHDAPLSSLSISNDPAGSHQLSGMVLTSSFDWTVKLWNPKVSSGKPKCILTFDCAEDYVYDVAWNPTNPGLFSSVDGEGFLDIWDLAEDIENPAYHEQEDKFALNKCRWSIDGTKLATGDSRGNMNIYNLDRKFQKVNENKTAHLIDLYEPKA